MAESCYVDKYLPASFKGISFQATEISSEHGRRGATGEFPFGEFTAYADLGRRIRTYSISGKFYSNDHIALAGLLAVACETPGPGILVHPTRGVITAACTSCKISDDVENEQGYTSVSMEFVEANLFGTGFNLGQTLVSLLMTGLAQAVNDSFYNRYDAKNSPFYQTPTVLGSVSGGLKQVRNEYEKSIGLNYSAKNWAILADMNTLIAREASFIDKQDAFGAIERSLSALSRTTSGATKYTSFKVVANWAAKQPAMRGVSGQSVDATYSSYRLLSAGYMARGYAEAPTSTYTVAQSLKILDDLEIIFTEEANIAFSRCDSQLHLEITRYWFETRNLILNRIYNIPPLVVYDFGAPTSSLKASYEIYGDSKRFLEIEALNTGMFGYTVGPKVIAPRNVNVG